MAKFDINEFKKEFKTLSLGLRLNNIGCIRYSQNNKWIGQKDSYLGFVRFDSFELGVRALVLILMRYFYKYRLFTLEEIISRYAPSNENKTQLYIQFVHSIIGFSNFSNKIDLLREQLKLLILAISCVENGIKFFSYCVSNKDYLDFLYSIVDKYFNEYCNSVIFVIHGKVKEI